MTCLRVVAFVLAASVVCSARSLSSTRLYPVVSSDSTYESNCPSDANHMNGCFHFNITTSSARSSVQLLDELTYVLDDTLLVDPRYIGQTAPPTSHCAALNQIHSHLSMVGKPRCQDHRVVVYGHELSISASQDHLGCLQVQLSPPPEANAVVVAVSNEASWDRVLTDGTNVYHVCGPEEIPQVTLTISF